MPYPIDSKFLKGFSKVLQFEGVLRYVSLPRLQVAVRMEDDVSKPKSSSKGQKTQLPSDKEESHDPKEHAAEQRDEEDPP
jgi:hypothetical protein